MKKTYRLASPIAAAMAIALILIIVPATRGNAATEDLLKAKGEIHSVNLEKKYIVLNGERFYFTGDRATIFLSGKDLAVSDVVILHYKKEGKINSVEWLDVYSRGSRRQTRQGEPSAPAGRPNVVY